MFLQLHLHPKLIDLILRTAHDRTTARGILRGFVNQKIILFLEDRSDDEMASLRALKKHAFPTRSFGRYGVPLDMYGL